GDVIDLIGIEAGFLEAVGARRRRKVGVVPLAAEPLFLGGGDDVAVDDQGGRTVVVEGRDAEDGRHDTPPCASGEVARLQTVRAYRIPARASIRTKCLQSSHGKRAGRTKYHLLGGSPYRHRLDAPARCRRAHDSPRLRAVSGPSPGEPRTQ